MIGGLPQSSAEAIGHDILVAVLVWLGAIAATAVTAILLGIMARKAQSRNRAYGAGAITCGMLSIGLLLLLLHTIAAPRLGACSWPITMRRRSAVGSHRAQNAISGAPVLSPMILSCLAYSSWRPALDHALWRALLAAMFDRPARIVYARPPGKGSAPYKPQPPTKLPAAPSRPPARSQRSPTC